MMRGARCGSCERCARDGMAMTRCNATSRPVRRALRASVGRACCCSDRTCRRARHGAGHSSVAGAAVAVGASCAEARCSSASAEAATARLLRGAASAMAPAAPAAVGAAAGAAAGNDVPLVGLSLAALRAFVRVRGEEYARSRGAGAAERVPFEQLTTKQLCDACVKPLTHDAPGGSCSYAELLQAQARAWALGRWDGCGAPPPAADSSARVRQNECDAHGRPFVARATLFVSHAWSYRFADIVSALEAHYEAQPDADRQYFWLGAALLARACALQRADGARCARMQTCSS